MTTKKLQDRHDKGAEILLAIRINDKMLELKKDPLEQWSKLDYMKDYCIEKSRQIQEIEAKTAILKTEYLATIGIIPQKRNVIYSEKEISNPLEALAVKTLRHLGWYYEADDAVGNIGTLTKQVT